MPYDSRKFRAIPKNKMSQESSASKLSCHTHPQLIQTIVTTGKGEKQKLVVATDPIAPPSPALFRVIDTDKRVVITNRKLIVPEPDNSGQAGKSNCPPCSSWGKVIINGYIDKNVIYKTISDFTSTAVNGPVFQFTTQIEFSTFIEVHAIPGEQIRETDEVIIENPYVEGESEEPVNPNPVAAGAPPWAITYNDLLEKIIVKINVRTQRQEGIFVNPVNPAPPRDC